MPEPSPTLYCGADKHTGLTLQAWLDADGDPEHDWERCGLPIRKREGGPCIACGHERAQHVIAFGVDHCGACAPTTGNAWHASDPGYEHIDPEGACAVAGCGHPDFATHAEVAVPLCIECPDDICEHEFRPPPLEGVGHEAVETKES